MGHGLQPAGCAQGTKKDLCFLVFNASKYILGPINTPAVDILSQTDGHGRQAGVRASGQLMQSWQGDLQKGGQVRGRTSREDKNGLVPQKSKAYSFSRSDSNAVKNLFPTQTFKCIDHHIPVPGPGPTTGNNGIRFRRSPVQLGENLFRVIPDYQDPAGKIIAYTPGIKDGQVAGVQLALW